ncbi:MAG TPA: hypothetical protein VFW65_21840 [Pseudonocardiaceae bacterium]|nr:hypothetical protein [Pseudonocardiaceae bacterium]
MNEYATRAAEHWRTFLPNRYRQISNPDQYFQRLGQEVETEIAELTEALAGDDLPGEDYLGKVGRLTAARRQAEEKVLAERVLLPAEPGTPMDETEPTPPTDTSPVSEDMPPMGMQTDWIPTVDDPNHPFWRDNPPEA